MSGASPTELTLRRLRADGWPVIEVVERWVPWPPPGHRVDLFGIIDVLAIGPSGTLAIQATSARSRGTMSHRKAKMAANPATALMLDVGWRVQIWGWLKPAHRWQLRIWDLTITDGQLTHVMHTTNEWTP